MKQELTITVPKDWSAVTLNQYLELRKDMLTYEGDEEALTACLFHHLCKFPLEYLQQLDLDTYISIKREILDFYNKVDYPLKKFIHIDGVKYGFEPNLSQMAYGAYVDISKYETLEIDTKWAEIMSILYRPVVRESGALYDIKPYDGNIDGDKFMEVAMDVHFGSLFFLSSLLKDLLNDTQKSLMGELMETDLPLKLKQILAKNGNLTHQLSNYHKEILPK
jgi:hypothetical protein